MKKIWKVLLGAAAVAAVTPYSVKKDEETGEVKLKAAVWAATYTKDGDEKHVDVKLLPVFHRDEECCCEEDDCCCEDGDDSEHDGITIEVTVEPDDRPREEPHCACGCSDAAPEAEAESEAPAEEAQEEPRDENA